MTVRRTIDARTLALTPEVRLIQQLGVGYENLQPSSPETRHLIGSAELARMQSNAVLINTARGDLVNEAALRRAIETGQLGGAGIDVLEVEANDTNPFADLSQVIVTPHSAGISRTSLPRAIRQAGSNLERFVRGEPIEHLLTARGSQSS